MVEAVVLPVEAVVLPVVEAVVEAPYTPASLDLTDPIAELQRDSPGCRSPWQKILKVI